MSRPAGFSSEAGITIGVDLGGTGTRIVAVGANGSILAEEIRPTPNGVPPEKAFAELVEAIRGLAGPARIIGVGIGASGPVDRDGIIRNPDTLPSFSDVPLTAWISESLDAPCLIDNDAAAAALGEYELGAGRGSRGLVVVTLGTGIGVGVLCDGQPFRTADGSHPEAGHIGVPGPPAPCYCGLATCWEQLASRTALEQLTADRTESLAGSARAGDADAQACFTTYGERVGAGVATLVTVFGPDRVVLGGSSAQYLDLFRAGVDLALRRRGSFHHPVSVVAAELGPQSGAIGAASMARQKMTTEAPTPVDLG
jgi:glucokinase